MLFDCQICEKSFKTEDELRSCLLVHANIVKPEVFSDEESEEPGTDESEPEDQENVQSSKNSITIFLNATLLNEKEIINGRV